jgi:hypothetical protein
MWDTWIEKMKMIAQRVTIVVPVVWVVPVAIGSAAVSARSYAPA